VRRILWLWWIEFDIEGLLCLIDVESFPKRLIAAGGDLDEDGALRDGGNFGDAILVGAHLPTGHNFLAEFDYGMAPDELHQDVGAVNGLAAERGYLDDQFGHGRGGGPGGERQEQRHQPERKSGAHTFDYGTRLQAISGAASEINIGPISCIATLDSRSPEAFPSVLNAYAATRFWRSPLWSG
jgi:hypothetical protein